MPVNSPGTADIIALMQGLEPPASAPMKASQSAWTDDDETKLAELKAQRNALRELPKEDVNVDFETKLNDLKAERDRIKKMQAALPAQQALADERAPMLDEMGMGAQVEKSEEEVGLPGLEEKVDFLAPYAGGVALASALPLVAGSLGATALAAPVAKFVAGRGLDMGVGAGMAALSGAGPLGVLGGAAGGLVGMPLQRKLSLIKKVLGL